MSDSGILSLSIQRQQQREQGVKPPHALDFTHAFDVSTASVPLNVTLAGWVDGYSLDIECSIEMSYRTLLRGKNAEVPGSASSRAGGELAQTQEIKGNLYPPKTVQHEVKVAIPAAVGPDEEVPDGQGKEELEIRLVFTFWFKNGSDGKEGKETMGNQVWVRYQADAGQSDEERCKSEIRLLRYF